MSGRGLGSRVYPDPPLISPMDVEIGRDRTRRSSRRGGLTFGVAPRPPHAITAASGVLFCLLAACGPESYLPQNGAGGAGQGGGVGGAQGGGGSGGDLVDSGTDAGTSDVPASVVHFDFETSTLDGWQPVGSQRPPDVQDQVQRSTDAFHHGSSALAMMFDGSHAPLAASDTPYYGVYTPSNPPPAGAVVSMWLMSTAAGVSIQVYAQTKPAYLWQGLTISGTLNANTWTQITITMPTADAFYLGCIVNSALDIAGTIYLDDISW
jgi:hypothetical protein